ncbi:MAG: glycoside hydrolase family 97 catalytic domain-containing protein [Akkermansiaceae bacterium]|nr:glycoside hydrolase family 97 catalytic domain-containing protein [Verrucomicrobiales bacterium]
MKLRYLAVVGLLLARLTPVQAAENFELRSPDQKLLFNLQTGFSSRLTFDVKRGEQGLISPSALGVTVNGVDLGANAKLGSAKLREINEVYPLNGVRTFATNHCHEALIPITGGSNTAWTLEVRAFNDGVAYRYRVPGAGRRVVNGEASEWKVPAGSTAFYQDNSRKDYESAWRTARVGQHSLREGLALMAPITFKLESGGYLMITEANLVDYSDMALQPSEGNSFRAFFYNDARGWTNRDEIVSPWRVTLVAPDLNTLVNSDILQNLCPSPAPELVNADWIQPGRSTWHWMVTGRPRLEQQRQWIDWTHQLGFEYYLIDDGWVNWRADGREAWECMKEVVDYASSRNVKIWIWLHAKDIPVQTSRQAWFEKARSIGVVGVKLDFPQAANSEWVQWYDHVLRDAARARLMMNFHGALKPSGRERTWPNELTREAIRGRENRRPDLLHEAILPFTRFVQGPADFTPTEFRTNHLAGATRTREFAQAVVYTSPMLCYSGVPEDYLKSDALDLMKAIPATWDETIVLPGSEIGEAAAFARRKGAEWFIAVINGHQPRKLDLPLTFLAQGKYAADKLSDVPGAPGQWMRTKESVSSTGRFVLDVQAGGGFLVRLSPTVKE